MKLILILLVLPFNILLSQQLSTTFNGDLSKWRFDDLNFSTVFIKDNNLWKCDQTRFKTVFNNDWNSWRVGNDITIRTVYKNDYSSWEITTPSGKIRMRTSFSGNNSDWTISGLCSGSASTVFHNNLESWSIDLNNDDISQEAKKAILFVLIINTSI